MPTAIQKISARLNMPLILYLPWKGILDLALFDLKNIIMQIWEGDIHLGNPQTAQFFRSQIASFNSPGGGGDINL